MRKLKYATIYDDENIIEGGFHDTEAEAITEWEQMTGEKWSDGHESSSVQEFTQKEMDDIYARPEV